MKNNIILSIAAFLLLVFMALCIKGCVNGVRTANDLKSLTAAKDDTLRHTMDRYNTEHANRLAAEGNYGDLMATHLQQMDTASKRLQISRRQIDGLLQAQANVKGSFITRVLHDTLRQWFAYKDSSLSETVTIEDDTAHVTYEVLVPIFLTQYWRRPWLLGKKVKFIDGYSTNPNAHISGLESVRVQGKEPGRLGVGPFVGITTSGAPSIGLCLSYSIIRF